MQDLIEEYKAAEKADYVSWVTNSAVPPSNNNNNTANESRMHNSSVVTLDSRIFANTSNIMDT